MTENTDTVVIVNGSRDVKGIVSWHSIGRQLALAKECLTAADCLEAHVEVLSTEPLFDTIETIVKNGYVLVRGQNQEIAGIVTTRDLSQQFRTLGEPFLLLGEIENYLRILITKGQFTVTDLRMAADSTDSQREINGVADLTFGEYLRMLQSEEHWARLGIPVDRKTIHVKLERIREIRNDVMHFDPDGIGTDGLEQLRSFVRFLQELVRARIVRIAS